MSDRTPFRLERRPRTPNWYITWTEGRETRRKSTGTADRRSAQTELERFAREYIPGVRDLEDGPLTIDKLTDVYVNDRAGKVIAIASIHSLTKRMRRYFGTYTVPEIKQALINTVASDMLSHMAEGTAHSTISCLRTVLRFAHVHDLIDRDIRFNIPLKPGAPRQQFISKEDAVKLISAADEIGRPHLRLFLQLAFSTAKRRGAILDLKWHQVDFVKRLIDFGEGNHVKRRGVVPMNDYLYDILRREHAVARSEYVVSYGQSGQRLKEVRYSLNSACAHAGVERITPHVCRHSACTWMAMDGVSLREIARYAGMTEAIAERVYAKHTPDYLAGAANSLSLG